MICFTRTTTVSSQTGQPRGTGGPDAVQPLRQLQRDSAALAAVPTEAATAAETGATSAPSPDAESTATRAPVFQLLRVREHPGATAQAAQGEERHGGRRRNRLQLVTPPRPHRGTSDGLRKDGCDHAAARRKHLRQRKLRRHPDQDGAHGGAESAPADGARLPTFPEQSVAGLHRGTAARPPPDARLQSVREGGPHKRIAIVSRGWSCDDGTVVTDDEGGVGTELLRDVCRWRHMRQPSFFSSIVCVPRVPFSCHSFSAVHVFAECAIIVRSEGLLDWLRKPWACFPDGEGLMLSTNDKRTKSIQWGKKKRGEGRCLQGMRLVVI